MTAQKMKITLANPKMIDEPGFGLPSRDQLYTIAARLLNQTRDTISGIAAQGQHTGKSWDRGTLTMDEALYCVQYALSHGLNPFADIHIWWYKKIIVCEHYRILAGWARLREPYTDTYRLITDPDERARHSLEPGDLATICYIMRDSQKDLFVECLRNSIDRWTAMEIASTTAIGIVLDAEMRNKEGKLTRIDVRGWDWNQRAETRAFRNALGRSHGTPTPAEIQAYAQKFNPGLSPALLADPRLDPSSLPPAAQERLMRLNQPSPLAGQVMSQNDRVTLMRGKEEEQNGID
jgi:hypothetical protein